MLTPHLRGQARQSLWPHMNPQPQTRGLHVDHGVYLRYHRDHVWRLYALHGETLVGDAYTVAGFERKISKLAWPMMINCTSRRGAVHEILDAVNADFAPAFTFDEAMRLPRALEHRHAPVARSFYSVVGRRLQFINSQLLMRVLDRCLKDGIVGLPIHDSIIAKAGRDADRVSEIMVIVSKGNLQTAAPSAGRRRPSRPSSGYAGNAPATIRQ